MMINHNPYNLPEKPPQKINRIYTESPTAQYRKNESVDNPPAYSNFYNRNAIAPISSNIMMKKSAVNLDETLPNFRPPVYPILRNQTKHYMHSPKNQNSSSASNLAALSNISSSRGSLNLASSIEKKQTSNTSSLRESFGINPFDMKEINQKIQTLSIAIKHNEKRINELEKNSSTNSLPPQASNEETNRLHSSEAYLAFHSKCQSEWQEGIKKIKEEINTVREQVKSCLKPEADRLIVQKIQDTPSYHSQDNRANYHLVLEDQKILRKQIEFIRNELEEKIKSNHEFLTSVIARIEREFLNTVSSIPPSYKSSVIRCSGSAILLRFVESFKVRRNCSKGGEVKITLTDNTYYIDQQGFLLDKEQHYLVDARGNQIRLEQKHVRMLRQEKILL